VAYEDPTDLKRQARDAEADEAKALEARRKDLEDLRWLLGHPQGRRIAARILEHAGVFRSSYSNSGSAMAFAEGRRDVGLFWTSEFTDASFNGYMQVLKEFQGQR
jgi:hypothetical protein